METPTKNCIVCGTNFPKPYTTSKADWKKRLYCSRKCFGKDFSEQRKVEVECLACGKTFRRKHFAAKYCSSECAKGRYKDKQGEKHWAWKGGRHVDASGYVHVTLTDDHRFAGMRRNGRMVFEHRLVMAEHLGRPLRSNETVHHLNGKRDDNRIENLELRVGRHGKGAALCCADCGSRNLVAV
jgi:hypothetical protein